MATYNSAAQTTATALQQHIEAHADAVMTSGLGLGDKATLLARLAQAYRHVDGGAQPGSN